MADHATETKSELHPMHLLLFLGGGLSLGMGILNLYYSFGSVHGDINSNLTAIGFSGLDNISMLPSSNLSIPLIGIGALCLIFANATAWRDTDGY
jgi:hypothetical protein